MSTTTSQAHDEIRTIVEGGTALPLRWQGENGEVPVDGTGAPTSFVLVDFNVERNLTGGPDAFGGGRGSNLYRNRASLTLYVFVPQGEGLKSATDKAEVLAQLFRSYRSAVISCFAATVIPGGPGSSIVPPGRDSEVDNFYWAAVEVDLFFDLIG